MPTLEHEYVLHLCRNEPSLVVDLLRECFGETIPTEAKVTLDSGDFGEPETTERRGDTALLMRTGDTVHGLVVESQRKYEEYKFRRWSVYCATLADRYNCMADVVVFCPSQSDADLYDRPYRLGNGRVLHAYVIGPNRIPIVSDPARVATLPELGVLSAVAHGRREGIIDALLTGLEKIDVERAQSYTEILLALLKPADRTYVEDAVAVGPFRYQSEFTERLKAEGRVEGRAEGRAEDVLMILNKRGLSVDEATEARIRATTDHSQLDALLERALTAQCGQDTVRFKCQGEFTENIKTKGRIEGIARGRSQTVLQILVKRGLLVDGATRHRIHTTTDNDELDTLLDRAITAESTDELFD